MDNRELTIILGKTGCGKTTLAKEKSKGYSRCVIIDPKYDFEGLIFYDSESLITYHKENLPKKFIYVCRFFEDNEVDNVFRFCQIVGDILLIVYEAELYISAYSKSAMFNQLVLGGRHENISIIAISHRTTGLSNEMKSVVKKIISFKQTLPIDLKTMEQYGFTELEKLPEHEYKEIDY